MISKGIAIAATVLFAAVLAIVIVPEDIPAREAATAVPASDRQQVSREGLPYIGAGMQIQRVDWIDRYKQSVSEIADLGGDTVLLVVDARQENGTSSRIYLDMRMTPTPDQLGELIRHAKSRDMRVILMPIVLLDAPRGNEWRGTLKPASWEDWFDSYRQILNHFAWIAQANGVDVLVIGSELVSSESRVDQWTRTISDIREVFHGRITYSANWDHYVSVPFWDQLDLIGMNSYYKLGPNRHVTVEQIQQRWREIQRDLLAFQQRVDKPLLFLEVGWCSLANAAHEPWDYTKQTVPIDLDLQQRLYEGFFTSWWGNPALGGFMIWEWTPGDGGEEDRGYTPKGKPAEQVLRDWFAKERWEVR